MLCFEQEHQRAKDDAASAALRAAVLEKQLAEKRLEQCVAEAALADARAEQMSAKLEEATAKAKLTEEALLTQLTAANDGFAQMKELVTKSTELLRVSNKDAAALKKARGGGSAVVLSCGTCARPINAKLNCFFINLDLANVGAQKHKATEEALNAKILLEKALDAKILLLTDDRAKLEEQLGRAQQQKAALEKLCRALRSGGAASATGGEGDQLSLEAID